MKSLLVRCALALLFVAPIYPATVARTSVIHTTARAASADEGKLLKVHFIDVGGGDGILIDTPRKKKIIIDGGWTYTERSKAAPEYHAYLDRFLEDDVVDLMIISHPDYDHIAGLQEVLTNSTVRQLWYSGYDSSELSGAWNQLLKQIDREQGLNYLSPLEDYLDIGSRVRFDTMGTSKKSDDVVLTLINTKRYIEPTAHGSTREMNESQQRNSSSIVVKLEYGSTSFLFTGDTNGRDRKPDSVIECDDQELFMVENDENPESPVQGMLKSTVLKVPHHGSNGSSSARFLKAVKPEWAVITAGVPHDHPTTHTLDRLRHSSVGLVDARILRTDDGEDDAEKANETNLGDDCYIFYLDQEGIVKIEKWNVELD